MRKEMTSEVKRWLDENATVKTGNPAAKAYWDSLEGYEYLPWEDYRVSGEDQYGRKQYECVSGHGFLPKLGRGKT